MPHLVLQYSKNLDETIRRQGLIERLHACALETGVFPLGGTRTRALCCDPCEIADGHPDNAFLDLQVRIGAGRDDATKRRVGEALLAALCASMRETAHWPALAISLEICEIDANFSWRQNTLHERVKERGSEIVGGS